MPRTNAQTAQNPPPAPVAGDDFDEHTPPPRRRPQGDPVPKFTKLPPGESAIDTFLTWDRLGRIPLRCVLTRFTGTRAGTLKISGYTTAAYPLSETTSYRLGRVGAETPEDSLGKFRMLATIEQGAPSPGYFHVWAPQEIT